MPDMYMDVDTALSEVPVNLLALTDDTTFKDREEAVVYNQAGLDLTWNFVTTAGAFTQTAVTPTDAGLHDWSNKGNGMYAIEIPASGGTINNDTEGFGWFTGIATGILHWRGPTIGFRAAGLNNVLIDSPYSATRGLTGTAVPDAAADAPGGLPISDAGGLDLDTILDAAISSRSSHAAAAIWSVGTRTLTSLGASLVAEIWNALTSGMATAGSIGKKLADWVLGSDNKVEVSADAHTSGQTVAAVTGAVGSVTGAVGSVTADVGITQAGADKVWSSAARTLTSFGTLVSDIWSNATRTLTGFSTALALSVWDVLESAISTASSIGLKIKNNLDAAITTRATPAQVNEQILDVMDGDTYGEPSQDDPPATCSMFTRWRYLYKAWRNKKRTSNNEIELYNDAEDTVDQKLPHSDDGTHYTKGKVATGS